MGPAFILGSPDEVLPMLNRITIALLAFGLWACSTAMTQADDLKPFPDADAGFVRHVIRLPALDNEENHKVELVPGKTIEVDCNRHWFGGTWSPESISGWGYSYYLLVDVSGPASTMMACPPGEEKKLQFVPVRIEDSIVRYNSKLPIVVYTPAEVEVRYRVWSAAEVFEEASTE